MSGEQRIRILHISDLHARGSRDQRRVWKRTQVLGDAWRRNLDELAADGRPFDLVAFTGDVADWGLAKEYVEATAFVAGLLTHLQVPRERFFVVPGNHDIRRRVRKIEWSKIREGIRSAPQQVGEWMAGGRRKPPFGFEPAWRTAVLERERAFWTWVKRDLGRRDLLPKNSPHGRLGYRVSISVGKQPVHIIGLDSAWLAGDDSDAGRLWLTDDQLGRLCRDNRGQSLPGFRLALVHHPLSDLADADTAGRHLADTVDLVLRGHQHTPLTRTLHDPDRSLRELAAGCLYEGDQSNRYPNACQVIDTELDPDGRPLRYDIRFRAWSPNGFWHDDGALYREAKQGRLHWPVAAHAQTWPSSARPAEPLKKPADIEYVRSESLAPDPSRSDASLVGRYRSAVASHNGAARFYGIAADGRRPHATIQRIFVPFRLEPYLGMTRNANLSSVTELARALAPAIGKGPRRFVILGAPGTGKSTLCRLLAIWLAGGTELAGVRVSEDILPLFVQFRDYVAQLEYAPNQGLVEFLVSHAQSALSVRLSSRLLEERLEQGHAVLILDGLDEVSHVAQRAATRDRVQSFCSSFPRVPVLVSSRVAGYEDAPLDSNELDHLSIAPWSDSEIETFIGVWYENAEPYDADSRRLSAEKLLTRLRNDEGARELARNPLMATLLALTHSKGRELPSDRAQLFENCVRTLLEDWPDAHHRKSDEIAIDLQERYLSDLALAMQCSRPSHSNGGAMVRLTHAPLPVLAEFEPPLDDWGRFELKGRLTAQRENITDALAGILQLHEQSSVSQERHRGRAKRWLQSLEHDIGILVEETPGSLRFFHLAIMEYLAARALERLLGDQLAELVAVRCEEPSWREVCLFAVALRAKDEQFLNEVLEHLTSASASRSSALFLLQALREDVGFRPEQCELILRRAGDLAATGTRMALPVGELIHEIMQSSRSHAEPVTRWIHDTLLQGQGDDLVRVVAWSAWRSDSDAMLERVVHRNDKAKLAPYLMPFWPALELSRSLVREILPGDALAWALGECLPAQAFLGSSASLDRKSQNDRMAPALSIFYARRALSVALSARAHALAATEQLRARGAKFPPCLRVADVSIPSVPAFPLIPASWDRPNEGQPSRAYLPNLRFPVGELANELLTHYASHADLGISRYTLATLFDFDPDFAIVRGTHWIPNVKWALDHDLYLEHASEPDFLRPLIAELCSRVFEVDAHEPAVQFIEQPAVVPVPSTMAVSMTPGGEDDALTRMHILLAAEAAIALLTVDRSCRDERSRYFDWRMEARCQLLLWAHWEQRLPTALSTFQEALYLARGWTQCTITGAWPGTERWASLLSGAPPRHWLARAHWHLCWLIHDPNNAAHRDGYREALAAGRNDPELPGYADEMPEG